MILISTCSNFRCFSPHFASMDLIILLLLSSFLTHPIYSELTQPINPVSRITVAGVVYCDVCSTNTFSRHSYFLPGVDVHIQCKFKANSPKTTEQISFSVNRTTDRRGVYTLEIPSVEGVDCVEGHEAIQSNCQASLIRSSSPDCNVPGLKTTSNEITVKSKQDNLCIYSLNALSYRQSEINATLCSNQREVFPGSLNSSKFFLPYFPPYVFPWPQLPPFPTFPFPNFPPLPSFPFPTLPFPPLPPLPYLPCPPLPKPPSLPFPFPPLPPIPPTPSLPLPPPPQPGFNLGDPRTWIPYIPLLSPPPPPAFNLGDPRTWIPHIPSLPPPPPPFNLGDPRTWIPHIPSFSPPPPTFNLGDPRTWIPYIPPTPPNNPQNQKP